MPAHERPGYQPVGGRASQRRAQALVERLIAAHRSGHNCVNHHVRAANPVKSPRKMFAKGLIEI